MVRRFSHTWVTDWQLAPRSFAITNRMTMALPAPKRAKQKARDIYCTSTMRQALIAVFTYNADYSEGAAELPAQLPVVGPRMDIQCHRSHNHVEPSTNQDSFKRTPAFIWYGPPALYYEVAWNTGGHLYIFQNGHTARGQYVRRGVLFFCGTPWVSDNWTDPKMGEMPHRDWVGENNDPMYSLVPFAENIGMNDGSVVFYDVPTTVMIKP